MAYAAHGFDPSNAAVWAATLANAANLQLERLAEANASSRPALAASSSSKTLAEKDAARGEGPDSDSGSGSDGVPGGDWAGGEDPLPSLPFRALDVRLPDGLPSLPSVRAPEVPEITVESVGRAIGATQIAAAKLREEVEEGKIRAIIEQDAKAESERLERERTLAAEEIDAWDERFELRTMTRDGLLAIARTGHAGVLEPDRASGGCGARERRRERRGVDEEKPRERETLAGRGWCHHFTRVASRVASRATRRAHLPTPTSHLTNPASAPSARFGVHDPTEDIDDVPGSPDATGELASFTS